jgi:hypothetical protein
MKTSPLFLFILVCLSVSVLAQERRAQILQAKISSGHGTVTNIDGEVFEGKVLFNDNVGIVTVENDGDSWSFTAKKATSFTFYDEVLMRQRTFHVFDYKNVDTGLVNPAFFEALAEFKTFAVLAKIDPVEAKPQKGIFPRAPNTMAANNANKVAFQKETIFVMNDRGEMDAYLEFTEKEIEGIYFDTRSNRKKFIDDDLLRHYIGARYTELETFAHKNDLSFKKKEDLVKILKHYKTLLEY